MVYLEIGGRYNFNFTYGEPKRIEAKIDRYIDGDLDGGGYYVIDGSGEEHIVLFHDLFRKDCYVD